MSRQRRIRVKICGMTRIEDALCAVKAGVDALGFIFYEKSPRCIESATARSIIDSLPPFVDAVGVVVNRDLQQVAQLIKQCNLTYVQLHGSETPEYCQKLADLVPTCRLLKAIRVGPQTTAAEVASYQHCVQGYLLDTYRSGAIGGTGEIFDWSLLNRLELRRPFLLAGGLTVDNIESALQCTLPYGVDANSGLEDAPGIKNHHLVKQFLARVRQFESNDSAGQ